MCHGQDCRILIAPLPPSRPTRPGRSGPALRTTISYPDQRAWVPGLHYSSRRVFINTPRPHPLAHFQLPLFIFLLHPGFQVLLWSANRKRSVYIRATDVHYTPPPYPRYQRALPHRPAKIPPRKVGGRGAAISHLSPPFLLPYSGQ
jgi:hypothetical protein